MKQRCALNLIFVSLIFSSYQADAADNFIAKGHVSACYIVYKTEAAAAARCPKGVHTIVVHDFWTGEPRGYSCDCSTLKNQQMPWNSSRSE